MPVNIRGKQYATVAERLEVAHGELVRPDGITQIDTTVERSGDFVFCKAVIHFTDGRQFSGMAEVSRGNGNGPQATSPLEVAETSAVGRALAMAGYFGSGTDSLAGAEEVVVAEARRRMIRR